MVLKTLEEHNRERGKGYGGWDDNSPKPNGIACPKCGAELMDARPLEISTSMPPQKATCCNACGYHGFRVC